MSVIPMNQQGDLSNKDISLSSSRLCWVLNRDSHPYTGTFRGVKITIPANLEKIPKRAETGGNLLPYLEACHFVRDLKEPQGFQMDSAGKPFPIMGAKMLFEQELTKAEYESITGSKLDVKKEAATEERKARQKLAKELITVPNKTAVEDESEE